MKSPMSQYLRCCSQIFFLVLVTQALAAVKTEKASTPPGGCDLYPIALSLSSVSNISTGTVLSLKNGAERNDFGWLTWTGNRSQEAFATSLSMPGDSDTYVNPYNRQDREIDARKWVHATGSDKGKNVITALNKLKNREIVVPLWYQVDKKAKAFRVAGFAKVQLLSYDLDNTDKISVRYLGTTDCHKGNDAPVVYAGEDQVIPYPTRANLNGYAADDGLPRGGTLIATWSKVSGPGEVVFADPRNPITRASFSDAGTYVLRLSATDSAKSASDDVTITLTYGNTAPVANAQTLDTSEDVAVNVSLTGSDMENDPLTFTVLSNPTFGTLSGTAPALVYTPNANLSGTDSFTFKVNDGNLDSDTATVTINVAPVNDAPVAYSQSVSTDEDVPVSLVLGGNDVEGAALGFTIVNLPAHGTLSGTAPDLVYTPAANYFGSDQFTFTVNDGTLTSPSATVTLTVRSVNDVPVAQGDSRALNEGGSVDVVLRGSDVEGSPLTFSIVTGPAHGILNGMPPNLTYVPNANFNGPDSFTFRVNDGTADSTPALVTLEVRPVNDAPTAMNGAASVDEDASVDVVLLGSDPEGSALTFIVLTSPAHGVLNGTAPNLTYVPNSNYNGPDSFTFKVNDGQLDSGVATVTLTVRPVNDAPVAVSQQVSLAEDSFADVVLTGTDVEGSPLTFTVVGQPAHGVLSGTAPNVRYFPNPNYNGTDSFTFKVNDGTADSAPAFVNIDVQAVNDGPSAVPLTASLDEDGSVGLVLRGTDLENDALTFAIVTPPAHGVLNGTVPNLTYVPAANYFGNDSFTFKVNDGALDSDPGVVTLTVRPVNDGPVAQGQQVSLAEDSFADIVLTGTDVDGDSLTYTVMNQPAHGVLSGTPPTLRYVPDANYHGPDSFTFKVNDGTVDSTVAVVQITVTPVNDPPVAQSQSVTTEEDTALNITLTGSDIDGDVVTFRVVNLPAHGTLSGTAPNLTYTPSGNFNGLDSFGFVANDGTVDSAVATVGINVTPVNDPPVASPVSASTLEDTPVNLTLSGSDVEGSELTFIVTRLPAHGTLSGNSPDLVYTPNANYNGSDSFAYRVFDGTDNSAVAEVTITVTPVNDAPVADAQSVPAIENETTPIMLTGSDVDGDTLTYTVVDGPTHGTLSGDAPNLTYVPDLTGHPETDSFTFSVSDGVVNSTLATVTIDIIYNQPPVVSAGPDRAVRSLSDVITLAGSATDDGILRPANLQVSWVTKFGPGTVTFGDASSAVTSASFSDRGLYILELSANDGQYSASDLVEVRVDMICSANPSGAVAWWPANYVPTETISGNTAVFQGGATYGVGKVGGGFAFDGIDGRVSIAPHPSLDLGAGNSFTIEFWMNSADVMRTVHLLAWHSDIDLFAEDFGVNIFQSGGNLHAQIYDTNSVPHEFVALNSLTNNQWTHVAITYDRTSGQGRTYVNGALRTTSNIGNFRPRTTFPLFFGHVLNDDTVYFEGSMDEIAFYTRALDAQEVYEIFAANDTGKCPISVNLPPLVNAGPDAYLRAPGTATLHGSATDDNQPAPASLRAAWSVVTAPGTVSFANSAAMSTDVTVDSPGIYVLRLTVDDGAIARSDTVELRVASLCTVKDIPGLVAWFPGNGNNLDMVSSREARLGGGTSFVNGRVGSAFNFDGVNDSTRVLGDSALDVGVGSGFSLEFWVNSADAARNARMVGYHNGIAQGGTNIGVNVFQFAGNVHAQIPDPAGAPHEFVANGALTSNTWTHIAVTYDRTRGIARTYINGAQRVAANVGIYLPRTVGNLHFGNLPFEANFFRGMLDEVSVYNRTLDAQEVFEIFNAGSVGKCPINLNQGPIVNAGPDLYLRDTVEVASLNGTVSDDGLPPGYPVTSLWGVADGPGIVTFADPASPVTTATFSAPGLYLLRLTADDAVVSVSDLVEVRVASLCTVKDPAGLVAWWPANGNGNDVVGVNNARLGGGTAFATGKVLSGFRFDGSNDTVQIAAHPSLDVGQGNGLTVEFWMNSLDVTRFTRVIGWHFGMGTGTNFGVNIYQQSSGLSAQIHDLAGQPHEMTATSSLVSNAWTHVAVTYDRTSGQGRIFINGALRTSASLGIYQPRTSYNLYFGNVPSDTGFFRGMLDEVSIYNRPLDVQEIYDIYNSGAVGKCQKDLNQPPVVNAGPNLTVAALTDVAALNGSATDDGLPPGVGLRSTWSKFDGPGTVTFGDPNAPVTTASFSAPGIYVLNLTADDAQVVRNDLMEVRVAAPCTSAPGGLVAWWPGNGTAQEILGGRDGRLAGGTAFASGRVSSAFSFDGTNDAVHIAAHPTLDVGLGTGLTLEFWMNPADVTRNARMLGWHSGLAGTSTNFGVNVQMLGRTVDAQIYDLAGVPHDVSIANVLTNNTWTHVVVTYDRAASQGRVYINGVLRTTLTVGNYVPRTNYRLYFGNLPTDVNFYRGLLDEVSIYDHALTSNEVASVFAAGASGKCPPAPVSPMFVTESANPTVTVDEHGRRVAMSDASGTTSLTYDAAGRVTRIAKSWAAHDGASEFDTALVYEYDVIGRFVGVHSTSVNGASMRYVWSESDQLLEVVDPHSGSTVYHYDEAGKAVGYTYPDNVSGSRFGVLDNVGCFDEPGATVVCDADGHRVRKTVTNGSRTVTTYYVVSPLTVTGNAQLVEELTFDSGDPLFATPAVTRVFVHGLHTISHEQLENGAWELYFYE